MAVCSQSNKYPFCVYRGSKKEFTVFIKNEDGTAFDLTNYDAKAQIRIKATDPDPPLLTLTSNPAAGLTISIPDGSIDVFLTPTQTSDDLSTASKAYWDLLLINRTDPNDVFAPVSTSRITFEDEVTSQ